MALRDADPHPHAARPYAGVRDFEWRWLAGSLLAIGGVVAVHTQLQHVNPTIAALAFLLVVFGAAANSTIRVATVASIAATACFNFFFLPPTGTWTIAEPQNWFALFTLLVVSVVVSRLSARARSREQEAVTRRDELARLFDLTRDILQTAEVDDPIAAIARHVARRFRFTRVSIFSRDGPRWIEHAAVDPIGTPASTLDALSTRAHAAESGVRPGADPLAHRIARDDGRGTWLVPVRIGQETTGALAVESPRLEPGTLDAIAGVVSIAIERQQLIDERREADLVRRSVELRSALLASLSHDLRTPLTAVTVASNNLDAAGLSDAQRRDQVDVIRTELSRLNRLFANIVDMARIETSAITPEPQWVDPEDIIEAARRHVGAGLAGHVLHVDSDNEVVVHVDPRLTSTALAHLLENAAQYSPTGTGIDVTASAEPHELHLAVRDRGPGLASSDLARVFDRFYRGAAGQQRFGTGMGLAITRGLLSAMGGRVWAENVPDGGARFVIAIPAAVRSVAATVSIGDAQ